MSPRGGGGTIEGVTAGNHGDERVGDTIRDAHAWRGGRRAS
ncbi:MAG: hypothetical protein ACTSU5_22070 [Promethearchaeota archaeon]